MSETQPKPDSRLECIWSWLLPDRRQYLRKLDLTTPSSKLVRSKEDSERLALVLAYASEVRKFEIERLWQRSLFFWGPLLVAFGGYAKFFETQPRAALGAAAFGFVGSLAWTLQNRGSKYWQEAWEQKVEAVQEQVLGAPLFSNPEIAKRQGWLSARRYSPSKLAIILSDYVMIAFLGLGVAAFQQAGLTIGGNGKLDLAVSGIVGVSAWFALSLWIAGRSSPINNPDDA